MSGKVFLNYHNINKNIKRVSLLDKYISNNYLGLGLQSFIPLITDFQHCYFVRLLRPIHQKRLI